MVEEGSDQTSSLGGREEEKDIFSETNLLSGTLNTLLEDESQDDEDLKENWFQTVDDETGRTYYVNRQTRISSWTKPVCFKPDEEIPRIPQRLRWSTLAENPEVWRSQVDTKTGKTYYFNKDTREVSWVKPKGFKNNRHSRGLSGELKQSQAINDHEYKDNQTPNTVEKVTDGEDTMRRKRAETTAIRFLVESDDDEGDVEWTSEHSKSDGEDLVVSDDVEDNAEDDDGGPENNEFIHFTFAQHRKGFWNRYLHRGAAQDEKHLLTFKKSVIKKAILKRNRRFDAEATQFFKNLMGYMGDLNKTSKATEFHAQKLVTKGLTAPDSLKDEIFLQICKQVNGHPVLDNCIKGWEMMSIVLGCFCPSRKMEGFLRDFINRNINDPKINDTIRMHAQKSIERMNMTFKMGQRANAPSVEEIRQDREGKPVTLKIHCFDGIIVDQEVDVFTTVKTVRKRVLKSRGIKYKRLFNLFQEKATGEVDIFDDKARILDIYAKWEESARSGDKKTKELYRFILKAELVVKSTDRKLKHDIVSFDLVYHQAVHDITRGVYPSDSAVLPTLAALYFYISDGKFDGAKHTEENLNKRIEEFLPESQLSEMKGGKEAKIRRAEFVQKVITKYASIGDIQPIKVKKQFICIAEKWDLYGAVFIEVEQKQLRGYPKEILVAINIDGIRLVHPKTLGILDSFPYSELMFWDNSDEKFVLVLGNRIKQRKLFLSTQKGAFMNHSVAQYVALVKKYAE